MYVGDIVFCNGIGKEVFFGVVWIMMFFYGVYLYIEVWISG